MDSAYICHVHKSLSPSLANTTPTAPCPVTIPSPVLPSGRFVETPSRRCWSSVTQGATGWTVGCGGRPAAVLLVQPTVRTANAPPLSDDRRAGASTCHRRLPL